MKKYFNSLNTRKKVFVSLVAVAFLAQFFMAIIAYASIIKCSYSLNNQAENLGKLAQDNADILLKQQDKKVSEKTVNSTAESTKLLLKQKENQVSELCYCVESAYMTNTENTTSNLESKVIGYAIDNSSILKNADSFLVYSNSRIMSDNVYKTNLNDWNNLTQDERSEFTKDKIGVSESEMPENIQKEFNILNSTSHTMQEVCKNNESISKIYIASNTGIMYGYGFKSEEKLFDARTQQWYKDAVAAAKDGGRTVVWQNHTTYDENDVPHIVCSKAYFSSSGAIKGVIATELCADKLCEQISQAVMSDDKYIFAFDNNTGKLIKIQNKDSEFWEGFQEPSESYNNLIMSLKNSECATIDVLLGDGKEYIVSYAPIENINWSLGMAQSNSVTTVDECDNIKGKLLYEITKDKKNSGADISTILFQFFIIICAFSFVLYAMCGVLTKKILGSIESDQKDAKKFRKLSAELEVAQKIQKGMFPKLTPFNLGQENLEIYATNVPAEKVGGDFYDFFPLNDGRLALIIADASDKGMPAALLMSAAKKLIKTHIQRGYSLDKSIEAVNDSLYDNNDMRMFVTAFIGVLDLYKGNMEYINAGHNPPLFYNSQKNSFEFLEGPHNCALGGIKGKKYSVGVKKINYSDALLLYTDGVTESVDSEQKLFSQEKLKEFVNQETIKHLPMKKLVKSIQKEIKRFSCSGEYKDDVTILGFRNLDKSKN